MPDLSITIGAHIRDVIMAFMLSPERVTVDNDSCILVLDKFPELGIAAKRGCVNRLAGVFNAKSAVPTRDEILTQAKATYDAANSSG